MEMSFDIGAGQWSSRIFHAVHNAAQA